MASRLEVRHYPKATGLAGAHTVITTAKGKRCLAELSAKGRWSINVARTDPALAGIGDGDYVQFVLDGAAIFTGVYDEERTSIRHPDNEIGEDAILEGDGLIGEWSDAIVRPPTPAGSDLYGDRRYFDWSTPELDDTGWDNAVQLYRQDSAPAVAKVGKPMGHPDPVGYWVWSAAHGGDYLYDPGVSPFRGTFTLAEPASVALYMAADDGFIARLNGVDLGGNGKVHGWETIWRADVDLPAGTHVLAVLAENYDRLASTNTAGFIAAVYTLDATGRDDVLVSRAGSGTKTMHYPDPLPGFTVGHVIRLLKEENPNLDGWTLDFTDGLDSAGNAWPTDQTFAFDVGRDLLSVLLELASTHIDFTVDEATRTLHAWVIDTAGSSVSVAALTAHAEEIGNDRRSQLRNSLLVRWARGQLEVEDTASVTEHGDRWGYLALGAVDDDDAAEQVAQTEAERLGQARDRVTAVLNGRRLNDNSLDPFDAWDVGDHVTLLDRAEAPADYRVLSIAVAEDDKANITVVASCNSRLDPAEVRNARAIERMQHGTLEGRSQVASPPSPAEGVKVRKAETEELEWAWVGGPIENGVGVQLSARRFAHPGRIVLATYDWNDPPADSAVTIEWQIGGAVGFTHTLPVDTDPHREYPSLLYSREKIMPTCTAADSVAENLTAVLTVLFFV